jgi:hypothetical protein
MGYDRARDLETFQVNLEHHAGLSMRVRRPGFDGERALRRAWPLLESPTVGRAVQEPALAMAAGALAGALVDWTLELDGAPVPCTPRGLGMLDTEFLLELVTVWATRVALRPHSTEVDADGDQDEMPPGVDDDSADGVPASPGGLDEEWLAQLPTVPVDPPAAVDAAPAAEFEGAVT